MNHIRLLALVGAFAPVVAACGPNHDWNLDPPAATPNGQLEGTVDGASFALNGAVARIRTVDGGKRQLELVLSDKPLTCAAASVASSRTVVVTANDDKAEGAYAIIDASTRTPTSREASADYYLVDDTCKQGAARSVRSGTITFENGDARAVAGSVDIELDRGRLSGTFSATICSAPAATDVCPER